MTKEEFLELVTPVAELVGQKDRDYNTGVELQDYFPFGHKSYVHMINTKTLRLVSLADRGSISPKFEPVEDSVMDCIAYCVFYLDYLKKEKP